jgi:hypothetical protein
MFEHSNLTVADNSYSSFKSIKTTSYKPSKNVSRICKTTTAVISKNRTCIRIPTSQRELALPKLLPFYPSLPVFGFITAWTSIASDYSCYQPMTTSSPNIPCYVRRPCIPTSLYSDARRCRDDSSITHHPMLTDTRMQVSAAFWQRSCFHLSVDLANYVWRF